MGTTAKVGQIGLWLLLVVVAMSGCMPARGFGPPPPPTASLQRPPLSEEPAEGADAFRQLNPDLVPRTMTDIGRDADIGELRRLFAEMQKTLEQHGKDIKDLQAWRKKVSGQVLRLGELLQRMGKTEANISELLGTGRKGSLLLNLGNITIWEFSWIPKGDALVQAHVKKYHELKGLLARGDEDLVSIVALCADVRKCDTSAQKADLLASAPWLNRPGTVQKQPGRGKETANALVITVRRIK